MVALFAHLEFLVARDAVELSSTGHLYFLGVVQINPRYPHANDHEVDWFRILHHAIYKVLPVIASEPVVLVLPLVVRVTREAMSADGGRSVRNERGLRLSYGCDLGMQR